MEYIIKQWVEDIYVYKENKLIIQVKKQIKWSGTYILKFYLPDNLILVSSYYVSIFCKRIKIRYSQFDAKLMLIKKEGIRYLKINNDLYGFKWHILKNPACTITKNNIPLGTLFTKKEFDYIVIGNLKPSIFFFEAQGDSETENLYCLIRLLIEFPPTSSS